MPRLDWLPLGTILSDCPLDFQGEDAIFNHEPYTCFEDLLERLEGEISNPNVGISIHIKVHMSPWNTSYFSIDSPRDWSIYRGSLHWLASSTLREPGNGSTLVICVIRKKEDGSGVEEVYTIDNINLMNGKRCVTSAQNSKTDRKKILKRSKPREPLH